MPGSDSQQRGVLRMNASWSHKTITVIHGNDALPTVLCTLVDV